MLKLENITVCIGSKIILENISCTIDRGDFVVIVGANGAGKTTLFDVIAGKIKPTRGTITLDGVDITHLSEKERAHLIGRLFQNPLDNCISTMTVAENSAIALCKGKTVGLRSGMSQRVHDEVEKVAHLLSLDRADLFDKTMDSLSGGQRQTISLLLATLIKPKMLLLDEPTAALDPQAATKLLCFTMNFIKQNHITTLIITHDPQMAISLGNKIWVLEKGHLTKEIDQKEKSDLVPSDLVGQVDYEKIARSA